NTPPLVWGQIFKACAHFLEECQNHPGPEQSADQISTLFQEKTRQRLESQALASGLDLTAPWVFNGKNLPSIDQICQNIAPLLPGTQKTCLVHGDFCLSNIFYDFRTRAIKVIDPRGLSFDGSPTLHGDPCYDIAKLAHSVTGKYDFILAGFFKLTRDGAHQINFELPSTPPEVAGLFDTLIVQGQNLNSQTLLSLQIHLFLSMLPLHNDDETRQQALLANALRLYLELETTR
ncbi:MAG: aminoglycoside phosphotransferase family protein, partial [Desulfovibrionales bacterium]|nr:aminoglycoside phosphotransferase family protein [Desulfovibrionales bacterium]